MLSASLNKDSLPPFIFVMLYADDMVMVQELQQLLVTLDCYNVKWRRTVNILKINIMVFRNSRKLKDKARKCLYNGVLVDVK